MPNSKILITGSKGLIGNSLKKSLNRLGFGVIGIDHAYSADHAEFGDIHDIKLIEKLAGECSGIVHLAGVSRVIAGEKNPTLCWHMNVEGTSKILEAAKKSVTQPWVIYASSREVYGQQNEFPVKESMALSPVNIYARSKVAAETLVAEFREKGLQTAVMRFSNVYGSTDDYADRVIPAFCRAAAIGGDIRIDGAENTFDFTYIDDVTDGIIRVIKKLQSGSRDLPSLHLVGGKATSLSEAAEYAKKCSDKSIRFVYAPSRSFDVGSFYGDPSLAKEILGWEAKVSIQEGIAQLIEKFKVYYSKLQVAS